MTAPVPSSQEVNKFHFNSDKDSASTAHHHSLGQDPNQASPGHHTHNGRNSKLLASHTLTGVLSPDTFGEVNQILNQLIAILENFVNITDSRTP